MQGRLRQEPLTFEISTRCAYSGQSLNIQIDGELNYQLLQKAARPLVFEPEVDWDNFTEPNIIDAY